ncbi:unnamed protein product [Heterobilharzia americana]|nr:unnamed protein product [Heterobilharzia americana]
MALDLSSVNDASFEDPGSHTVYNCVFLCADLISLPGTNDILFYISEVGHLILANFFVENSNGSYILKKLPSIKSPQDTSDIPTNLCLDKSFTSQEECLPPVSANGCSNLLDLNAPPNFGHTDLDAQPSALDCTSVYHAETFAYQNALNIPFPSSSTSLIKPCSEHPVDATVTRSHCDESTATNLNKKELGSPPSSKTRSNVLGQIVSELMHKMKSRMNTSGDQEIVVQGHNLSELERFVKHLRQFRLSSGLSQVQLSTELAKHYNNRAMFSQTLLSRFEKLRITVRSAYRLLPYLKRWVSHAEQKRCSSIALEKLSVFQHSVPVRAVGNARAKTLARLGQCRDDASSTASVLALVTKQAKNNESINNSLSISESLDSDISESGCKLADPKQKRRRRRRTYFSTEALSVLTEFYARNPRPKGSDFSALASRIGCDRESVRVWFCNRRQLDQECSKKT